MSLTLLIGQSVLPNRTASIANFVNRTAIAIKQNPHIAAEIHIAATEHFVDTLEGAELRGAIRQLVQESCKARDESEQAQTNPRSKRQSRHT